MGLYCTKQYGMVVELSSFMKLCNVYLYVCIYVSCNVAFEPVCSFYIYLLYELVSTRNQIGPLKRQNG